jgi:methionyl-tRNA formyltransferase
MIFVTMSPVIGVFSEIKELMMGKKVCFLGYDRSQTRIVEAIEAKGFHLEEISEKVDSLSQYDVVVSFGYRHILSPELLRTLKRPAINLHIAYLPYNRGAHPNFWSWIEGTPCGVTIHEIDKGIDTGLICFQKKIGFGEWANTFSDTYTRLIKEVEDLFIENIGDILHGTYSATPQVGSGSYHNSRDLPEWMSSWGITIEEAKRRYAGDK